MHAKYKIGDRLGVLVTIISSQIINGKIYYGVEECNELIPEDCCGITYSEDPKVTHAVFYNCDDENKEC